MDETKGWTIFGVAAVISLSIAVGQIASCKSQETEAELNTINRAIEAGIDPMAAKCAAGYSQTEEDVCMILAAKSSMEKNGGKLEIRADD
jgi:hypothetical protein